MTKDFQICGYSFHLTYFFPFYLSLEIYEKRLESAIHEFYCLLPSFDAPPKTLTAKEKRKLKP